MLAVLPLLFACQLAPLSLDDPDSLIGFWQGALVGGGSVQVLEVDIARNEEGVLWADVELPEWLWWPAPDGPVTIAEDGLRLPLVYGEALLEWDWEREELHGRLGSGPHVLGVHLKRALRPVRLRIEEGTVEVEVEGVVLHGTLYLPPWEGPHPAVVQVWSRGPHVRWEGDAGLGRLFAERGIAFLTYDKRGCGASGGDLERATHDELYGDLCAMIAAVRRDADISPSQVGLHAESAGGWLAIRAAGRLDPPPAFVATSLAPATSVRDQQDSVLLGFLEKEGFTGQDELALDYLKVLFGELPGERYGPLRERIIAADWGHFLEGDPETEEGLSRAWVRRHDYDPRADLERAGVPWLAHFGELDRVVDSAESIAALERSYGRGRADSARRDLTVVVLPDIQHGMSEWPTAWRSATGSPLRGYLLYNKLFAGMWQRELDWIRARVELAPGSPLAP